MSPLVPHGHQGDHFRRLAADVIDHSPCIDEATDNDLIGLGAMHHAPRSRIGHMHQILPRQVELIELERGIIVVKRLSSNALKFSKNLAAILFGKLPGLIQGIRCDIVPLPCSRPQESRRR